MSAAGVERLTKREWYAAGGFRNPALFRKADSRGVWRYYRDNARGGDS